MRLTADYQYKQAARGSDGALAAAARGPALAFPGRARFDPTDARWAPSARKLTGDAGRCLWVPKTLSCSGARIYGVDLFAPRGRLSPLVAGCCWAKMRK